MVKIGQTGGVDSAPCVRRNSPGGLFLCPACHPGAYLIIKHEKTRNTEKFLQKLGAARPDGKPNPSINASVPSTLVIWF